MISVALKLILLLYGTTIAYGGDFTYKFSLSSSAPYVKEAVIMKLDLVQTDHSKVILFKFTPKKSDDYTFHRLDMKEEDAYHAAKVHYTYLLYPKRSGEIKIHFKLIEMVTTDEKVAYSFSGDRDNVRGLNKTDIPIDLPPLKLQVKPLPKGTQLVGNFTLDYKIQKEHAEAFEPIPFTVTIKGTGYPPVMHTMIPKQEKFTLFKEAPIIHSSRSIRGTQSSVIYPYAISAGESFDLPALVIKAFDPKTRKSYELGIPKKHFVIKKPAISTLVDKTDTPKPLQNNWGWLYNLLGCLIVFAAGFMSAKLIKWGHFAKPVLHPDSLSEEIRHAADHKALLALLVATDSKRYKESIEKLEKHLYGKKNISLKQIKKALIGEEAEPNNPSKREYNFKKIWGARKK